MSALTPDDDERRQRDRVLGAVLGAIRSNTTIKLPDFARETGSAPALTSIGIEPNSYGGVVGSYRYQFEGEEDLLHLIVTRTDNGPLSAEDGQAVVLFLMPSMPSGLVWIRPGVFSQHFFCGHDDLLSHAT